MECRDIELESILYMNTRRLYIPYLQAASYSVYVKVITNWLITTLVKITVLLCVLRFDFSQWRKSL